VRSVLFTVAVALAGCNDSTTVVTPTRARPIEDNFFLTWEIHSRLSGPLDCRDAGASTVDTDLVNADTGERFIDSFDCNAFQGTTGPVSVGRFDVLVNLTDPSGGVIAQVDLGAQNLTTAGTIDLGHVVFLVP
jgi:hypothetical protein